MARRYGTRGVGLLAAALLLAWSHLATASAVATFRLTNVDAEGTAPVSSVLARVLPPGTVIPRDEDMDPPTILDPATGYISSGFNPDDLEVVLGNGTTSDGEPLQVVKLDFGPDGLAPGGRLYFQLNVSPAFEGMLRLVLPENVTNVAMESISVSSPPPPPDGGGAQVPEPRSVLVWLALPLLGFWRARAAARHRLRAAPAL